MKKTERPTYPDEKTMVRVLALLAIILISLNIYYVVSSNVPFSNDALNHYISSMGIYESLVSGDMEKAWEAYSRPDANPPLLNIQPIPLYFLFKDTRTAAILSNNMHLMILCLGTYLIARKMYDERTAFLSVVFLLFIPATLFFSRVFSDALSVASLFSVSLAALLWSHGMKHRRASIIFGVASALGFLTKVTFFIYFFSMSLTYAAIYIRHHRLRLSKGQMINAAMAGCIIMAAMALWYPMNLQPILDNAATVGGYHRLNEFAGLGLHTIVLGSLASYARMINDDILFYLCIPFILSIPMCFISRPTDKTGMSLAGLCLIVLISLIFFSHYAALQRYLLPFLPVFAIFMAVAVSWTFGLIDNAFKLHSSAFGLLSISLIIILTFSLWKLDGDLRNIQYFGPGEEYIRGLPVPRTVEMPASMLAETLLEHIPQPRKGYTILILPSTYIFPEVEYSLYREGIISISPLYCIQTPRSTNNEIDSCFHSDALSISFDQFDMIIDSDIYFDPYRTEEMALHFPYKDFRAKEFISRVQKSLEKYHLAGNISYVFLETRTPTMLHLYVKDR
jgi:hypothetical protein